MSLADGSTLTGFTLTNGYAYNGAGVFCNSTNVFVNSCVILGNLASGNYGGGAYGGTLNNCTLLYNEAGTSIGTGNGGGAAYSVLNNCIVSSNLAGYGGGAAQANLNNCTLRYNQATMGGGASGCNLTNCIVANNIGVYNASFASHPSGGGLAFGTATGCTIVSNQVQLYPNYVSSHVGGGVYGGAMSNCLIYYNIFGAGGVINYASGGSGYYSYCCTTPSPATGAGNITNAPLLVDKANGDFHLQSGSPCINSGKNSLAGATNDLDGNPRITGGTVDIGAYEYQTPKSLLSYAWALQYGLHIDGTSDFIDSDGDGMNNWQEWVAGVNPTNSASVLAMLPLTTTNGPSGIVVSWQSVTNRTYYLQRSSDVAFASIFSTIQSGITGLTNTTSFTNTTATNSSNYFYRVGVQ